MSAIIESLNNNINNLESRISVLNAEISAAKTALTVAENAEVRAQNEYDTTVMELNSIEPITGAIVLSTGYVKEQLTPNDLNYYIDLETGVPRLSIQFFENQRYINIPANVDELPMGLYDGWHLTYSTNTAVRGLRDRIFSLFKSASAKYYTLKEAMAEADTKESELIQIESLNLPELHSLTQQRDSMIAQRDDYLYSGLSDEEIAEMYQADKESAAAAAKAAGERNTILIVMAAAIGLFILYRAL